MSGSAAATFGVTAAHCFGGGLQPYSKSQRLALWLGDVQLADNRVAPLPRRRSFRVEAERICHPKWDGKCSHGHDIALLRLSKPLPDWVSPVALDLSGALGDGLGQPHVAIGFGNMESAEDPTAVGGPSPRLREVTLVTLSRSPPACSRVFAGGWGCSDSYSEGPAQNEEKQICVGTDSNPIRDACNGDSGSPLMGPSGARVGIVSYVVGNGRKVCGDPSIPVMRTQVSAVAEFMREHVRDISGSTPSPVGG